jgi:hypothetical protein
MESRPQPAPANWIKLHAQSIQSDVFQDADLWKLWCYILLRTSRNGNRWHIGGTIIEIGRGQCAIGRKQAATDCGFSEQHTRTLLSRLEKLGNLTIKSTNKATVVTVCNWDTYQSSQPANQPANQPAINQQSTSNQPAINHNLESKRVRETDNSTPPPPKGELPLGASMVANGSPPSAPVSTCQHPTKSKTYKQWNIDDLLAAVRENNTDNLLTEDQARDFAEFWIDEKDAAGKSRLWRQKTWSTRMRMQTAKKMIYSGEHKTRATSANSAATDAQGAPKLVM